MRAFLAAGARLPAAFLIEGEVGIGKTTVWEAAVAGAERSYRVLTARPSAAEAELAWVVIADLLRGTATRVLPLLAPPQRRVLEGMLNLAEPPARAMDTQTAGTAVLEALRALAARRPLLVAVDDVEWVDPSSQRVLAFALHRLEAAPVAVLMASAETRQAAEGSLIVNAFREAQLQRLRLGALDLPDLQELITAHVDVPLTGLPLRRIAAASGGNPYFALQFARALASSGDRPEPGIPLIIPATLRSFARSRLGILPHETSRALLMVALEPSATLRELAAILERDPLPALRPALDAGLLELDGLHMRFMPRVIASLVEATAKASALREAHRRLAAIGAGAERRLAHLALAREEPDAELAAQLDEAASLAHQRGSANVAAELSRQALQLTPVDAASNLRRRRISAARSSADAGAPDQAEALLAQAADEERPGTDRARVLLELADIRHDAASVLEAERLRLRALRETATDGRLQAKALVGLAESITLTKGVKSATPFARAAISAAEQARDSGTLARALTCTARLEFLSGEGIDTERLRSAIALGRASGVLWAELAPAIEFAAQQLCVRQRATAVTSFTSIAARLRDAGEPHLSLALTYLALAELLEGEWQSALDKADSVVRTARPPGRRRAEGIALTTRALVQAHRGNTTSASADAVRALSLLTASSSQEVALVRSVLGFIELSAGNPAAAHMQLSSATNMLRSAGVQEPSMFVPLVDDAEALLALGQPELAERSIEYLETRSAPLRRTGMLAAAGRCRGVLAASSGDLGGASEVLQIALARQRRVGEPFEVARTLLASGMVQRRASQRAAARESLKEALTTFQALGAPQWAARAHAELHRVPGNAPTPGRLTRSERRVAELVGQGRSNKEVAAALFVTVKAIEAHLTKVYRKLGIRSRSELVRRFGERDPRL